MVFGGEQGADVALEHEVRLVCALDGFCYLGVGNVNQCANLAADLLLPGRKFIDVGLDSWIGIVFRRFILRCYRNYLYLPEFAPSIGLAMQ